MNSGGAPGWQASHHLSAVPHTGQAVGQMRAESASNSGMADSLPAFAHFPVGLLVRLWTARACGRKVPGSRPSNSRSGLPGWPAADARLSRIGGSVQPGQSANPVARQPTRGKIAETQDDVDAGGVCHGHSIGRRG